MTYISYKMAMLLWSFLFHICLPVRGFSAARYACQKQMLHIGNMGGQPTFHRPISYFRPDHHLPSSTSDNVEDQMRSLVPKWKRLQSYLFPQIPFQDTSDFSIQDHFRPKLIAKEILLGARIMMRPYVTLTTIGWVFEFLIAFLPILPPAFDFSNANPLHLLDAHVKSAIYQSRLASWISYFCSLAIVTPMVEEVCYRGIGMSFLFWWNWVNCWLQAQLAFVSPYLLGLVFAQWSHRFFGVTLNLLNNEMHGPLLELIKFITGRWVPLLLELPLMVAIARFVRRRQLDGIKAKPSLVVSDEMDAAKFPDSKDENEIPSSIQGKCEGVVGRALGGAETTGGSSRAAKNLGRQLYRTVSLRARYCTSIDFAAAHVHVERSSIPLSAWDHYSFLRKYLGILASSLLIESRLVARRGNIWAAFGAHMVYNAITLLRLRTFDAFCVWKWDVLAKVVALPIYFVAMQATLDCIRSQFLKMEERLG